MAETSLNDAVMTTRLDAVLNWGRKNSLWPLPFGTACCAIEFMSMMASKYDFSRFGAEALRFSPRQSDLLLVLGTITNKQAPVLRQIYAQMGEPKWVISVGACASSGGVYRTYATLQGIDRVIPVDVYVPGCPPGPKPSSWGPCSSRRRSPVNLSRIARNTWMPSIGPGIGSRSSRPRGAQSSRRCETCSWRPAKRANSGSGRDEGHNDHRTH